ncbi:MAG: baseplate J/gp47 family protein [Faecalibacterium sp.]
MKVPILDTRSKAQIMEQFARLAAGYLSEWHYDGDPSDPAAALGELFGEMFYQTVDRFNAVPQKLHTEFLNLLGVERGPQHPAAGVIQFQVHEGVEERVTIPGGTMVYAQDEKDENIVYETVRTIEATPARLEDIWFSSKDGAVIQRLDLSRPQPFFRPAEAENLQMHRFSFVQNDVLRGSVPCRIEVTLETANRQLSVRLAQRLADPEFARWSWPGAQGPVPFTEVTAEDGVLCLHKTQTAPLIPDENGDLWLECRMQAAPGSVIVDGLRVRSVSDQPVAAQRLLQGDIPIRPEEGGYCFGRRPAVYDLFYIRSDEVFSKRGAQAMLRFELEPVVWSLVQPGPQYDFTRMIVDKNDTVTIKTDDVFVRGVVWEYYNGVGWTELPVQGSRNPFSCQSDAPQELRFRIPSDLCPVELEAQEGRYIRARVTSIENEFSPLPRWVVPFVRQVECSWHYAEPCPIQRLRTRNNASSTELETAGLRQLNAALYANFEAPVPAEYLRFDRSPDGLPIALTFDLPGHAATRSKILYEAWNGTRFEQVRTVDETRNLEYSGQVYLYLPQPLPRAVFFGQEGCWLRMSMSELPIHQVLPTVGSIRLNTVTAVQQQPMPEQRFSTGKSPAGQTFRLLQDDVLRCEVWVNESGALSSAELAELRQNVPAELRIERKGDRELCWVRWHPVSSLARCGPEERAYELEPGSGMLRFGDGLHGRSLPSGFETVRVQGTVGGGTRGNLPAGAVTAFLASIPHIASLSNITPMSGGADPLSQRELEALGGCRFRNRDRAVTAQDYEDLVRLHFPQVRQVRCFSGMDDTGTYRPGHLCVVVMGDTPDNDRASWQLCREIRDLLEKRCDCTLAGTGRVHVRSAVSITLNVNIQVSLNDFELAAPTQQEVAAALEERIETVWRSRGIGSQIELHELYTAVKQVPNVGAIQQLLVEGVWYENGVRRIRPIEEGEVHPFAAVKSGLHTVRIG